MYEKVKKFYELGLYTAEQVGQFAARGKLTPEEFREITGKTWVETGKEDI